MAGRRVSVGGMTYEYMMSQHLIFIHLSVSGMTLLLGPVFELLPCGTSIVNYPKGMRLTLEADTVGSPRIGYVMLSNGRRLDQDHMNKTRYLYLDLIK